MLEEGLFSEVKPEAMFGLHLRAELNVGQVGYRSGPIMAGSDRFRIVVTGRSTHGARPWQGVDPIVTAAQIVLGLQTIVARQMDITRAPVVVSVGSIKGGVRFNIIPDTVELVGTVRTFDPEMRRETLERIERIATQIAAAAGAIATVEPDDEPNKPVVNDPALTAWMLPTLTRIAAPDGLVVPPLSTVAEDFSFYSDEVPTLYVFVGSTPRPRRSHGAEQPLAHVPDRREIAGYRAQDHARVGPGLPAGRRRLMPRAPWVKPLRSPVHLKRQGAAHRARQPPGDG